MSTFGVSQQKEKKLRNRMEKLGVKEAELDEKFVLGSGSGGQKQNKTASCVHLKHEGHGIEVKCQRARSQALNRYYARQELCEKLEEKLLGRKSARQQKAEKIRRRKRRRSRRQKARMLEKKKQQSKKKKLRKKPEIPDE